MHRYDTNRFSTADWDEAGARWYRRNSKGARHYPPEWFPCRPLMMAALRDAKVRFAPHYCARWDGWNRTVTPATCKACGRPADIFVRDPGPDPLADEWMRARLEFASARAQLPWALSSIDFRHTFATWAREEGWEKDEVAKWLGNSTGMVDRVYAQIANARFERHVERASLTERDLLDLVSITQFGKRRGPRIVRTQFLPASKLHSAKG
jgi:integrase